MYDMRKERISMAREICCFRGENPNRVDRGGVAAWEKYVDLAGAVMREAERLIASRSSATILEQSEKLDGTIVQTVRRADGFEYVRECSPTMLELLIQAGYDASLAHPECFRAFSYVELAERLGIPLTTALPPSDRANNNEQERQ